MELCAFEGLQGDRADLKAFVDTLAVIFSRHANAVQTMAQGVIELKESHHVDGQTESSIQYFLDRFYMSRISTRMLTNQHYVLFNPDEEKDPRPNRVGVIDTVCNPKDIVMQAYTNASYLCEDYYYVVPDINIRIHNAVEEDTDKAVELMYPPQHLYHILFELFKNSMRAIVENKKKNTFEVPDIDVLIARGTNDVSIKISDQGGGIPRHIQDHLFHYLYSTVARIEFLKSSKRIW